MDANIAIAQAMGLRRVAADLDRRWDSLLQGAQTSHDEQFAGEEAMGCLLATPVLRALAAELALKAIGVKATGAHERGHDLLKLFVALDQRTQAIIEEQHQEDTVTRAVHGSVRSILATHKDDFVDARYVGENWRPGMNPPYAYGAALDEAVRSLIATFEKLP